MKIRSGFVSNSSSSSFIIMNRQHLDSLKGIDFTPIKIEYALLKYLILAATFKEQIGENLAFIYNNAYTYGETPFDYVIEQLEALLDKYPNGYITTPYDRDDAYHNDLGHCEVFIGDL